MFTSQEKDLILRLGDYTPSQMEDILNSQESPLTIGAVQGYLQCIRSILKDVEDPIEPVITGMLKRYGEDSQIDVCIEEMSELTKALVKHRRGRLHDFEKNPFSSLEVMEEIADVLFMIEYLKKIFNFTNEELKAVIIQKALRTKERYLNAEE